MIIFIKYLLLGIAGLVLRLSFPQLPIDWFAIVLAFAVMELGLAKGLAMVFVLAIFYASFSLAPYWHWVLPYSLAVLTSAYLFKNLVLRPRFYLGLLVFYFWGIDWVYGNLILLGAGWTGVFPWHEIGWGFLTVFFGAVLIPLWIFWLRAVGGRLFQTRGSLGELPRYRARMKGDVWVDPSRKPFGY